jgi:hypothetical protein
MHQQVKQLLLFFIGEAQAQAQAAQAQAAHPQAAQAAQAQAAQV